MKSSPKCKPKRKLGRSLERDMLSFLKHITSHAKRTHTHFSPTGRRHLDEALALIARGEAKPKRKIGPWRRRINLRVRPKKERAK